ncbi:MAG TPA: Gfo/Idh/MocA family oxidoreductase [Acidimicrobiia bacterium]|nr:Gfo/Idh/MocA family oxidoreductase [Acidimicrobiia bacterium]
MLRVAVVGTGNWWGREHARVFSKRDDAELVAIVGRSPAKTEARAREFGAEPYVDLIGMLHEQHPDLVSLCLPNEDHFDTTMATIEAGFPLLVEKPLVFDLKEADTLLEAAERRSLFFAINFNHRYAVPTRLAEQAIRDGKLGEVVFATWRFGGEPGTSLSPHANLIETQCHGFDMLEFLCGPIASVMAEMVDDLTGHGHSTVAIALRFAGGGVGSLVGSYDSSYSYPGTHRVEVNGTKGRLLIEDTVRRFVLSELGSETSSTWEAGYFNDDDRSFHAMFERHLDALIPALVNREEPPIHARAGRRALLLAEASIRSFETGDRTDTW